MQTFVYRCIVAAAVLLTIDRASAQSTDLPRMAVDDLYLIEQLTEQYPDTLAGVSLNDRFRVALVYVVAGREKEVEELVRKTASQTPATDDLVAVQLVAVERSWRYLNEVRERTGESAAWIEQAGSQLLAWHIDPELNSVLVGVSKINETVLGEARRRFEDAVTLYETQPLQNYYSKGYDTDPFAGGAQIQIVPGGGYCSTGFAIEKTSGNFEPWQMLTAGHCFGLNSVLRTLETSSPVIVGTVTYAVNNSYGIDSGRISYSNYYGGIYVTNTGLKDVTWTRRPVVGATNICKGGAAFGEHCGWRLAAKNVCRIENSTQNYTCYLDDIVRRNTWGYPFSAGPGDSGGPIYGSYTNSVGAIGVLVGGYQQYLGNYQWDEVVAYHHVDTVMPAGWGVAYR